VLYTSRSDDSSNTPPFLGGRRGPAWGGISQKNIKKPFQKIPEVLAVYKNIPIIPYIKHITKDKTFSLILKHFDIV